MKFLKNLKLNKKLLSMLTAVTLMATPVLGSSESIDENTDGNEFALVQVDREKTPMTLEEYTLGVQKAYAELASKIGYQGMQEHLQCLYYLVNCEYIPEEVEQELINRGVIFETNFDEGKFSTFEYAYSLINVMLDYNQSMVRNTDNIDDLIDPSLLCFNEEDAKLLHNMHENYFMAYKNGRYYNEDFEDNAYYERVFKQLTTLNGVERDGNNFEASVGAEFLALNLVGGDVMQMLRDDMQERYSRKELDKYFDKNLLNQMQWFLREDISLDLNRCVEQPDLESEVVDFAQLWVFVYDNVNNNIMNKFQTKCTKSK